MNRTSTAIVEAIWELLEEKPYHKTKKETLWIGFHSVSCHLSPCF